MPLTDRPAYCTVDVDLSFLSVNDRLLQVLGRTREDLIGRCYLDVYPESRGSELHLMLQDALRTLQPQRRVAFSKPLKMNLAVEVFPVAGGLQVAFSPA